MKRQDIAPGMAVTYRPLAHRRVYEATVIDVIQRMRGVRVKIEVRAHEGGQLAKLVPLAHIYPAGYVP